MAATRLIMLYVNTGKSVTQYLVEEYAAYRVKTYFYFSFICEKSICVNTDIKMLYFDKL